MHIKIEKVKWQNKFPLAGKYLLLATTFAMLAYIIEMVDTIYSAPYMECLTFIKI